MDERGRRRRGGGGEGDMNLHFCDLSLGPGSRVLKTKKRR